MSPPKKCQHKLGHLSEAEKHSVINVMKRLKQQYEDKGTSELVVEVARMLGLAKSTIYRILAEYKAKGKVGAPKKASGRPSITESFDESIKNDTRKVVHGFFFKNELPTLDKILCEIKQWPTIPNMSRSTLYKVMRHINFSRVIWRRNYLRQIRTYRDEGRHIYYLDETWLNEGHIKQTIWQDTTIRSKRQAFIEGLSTGLKNPSGKGSRLIILHIGSDSGFVDDCLLVFEGKKSTDYHEEMNSAVFEQWFESMLKKLPQNSVIVMDNAYYHSRRTEKIPSTGTRKKDIQEWLQSKNIGYNEDMVRTELLNLVKIHKEKFNSYVTDEMAQNDNKIVLRLPPYHCELNPVELIWAQIKNEMA
ncbi:hypothetical protein NQ315_009043 [Exocentrus adspersus]|uniref:Tc1-like transposase DDE domain-containing protein n=1 Tax=Exocentrus adspersus TaxID=1586481 RepID=A0AAV8VDE1_9CUCU|nr:hypothetical protein NQ315_009043 [Exocentrus adspersus]